MEGIVFPSALAVGFGGVFVGAPPHLLFVPDRDGDDVPDGPADVVLDGFTVSAENYHNFAWVEEVGGREAVVHRKGATPAGRGVMGGRSPVLWATAVTSCAAKATSTPSTRPPTARAAECRARKPNRTYRRATYAAT